VTTGSLVRQCHWFDRERTLRWGKYPAEVEERRRVSILFWMPAISVHTEGVTGRTFFTAAGTDVSRSSIETANIGEQGVTPCLSEESHKAIVPQLVDLKNAPKCTGWPEDLHSQYFPGTDTLSLSTSQSGRVKQIWRGDTLVASR